MLLQQPDRRQEALSLQATLVQLVGTRIGGCDQRHAAAEQTVEQSSENHRIADVADEELVEAQHLGIARDVRGNAIQRIINAFQFGKAAMHVLHDAMEVAALLRPDVERLVEKIHQEGLAASNTAAHVQAANRRTPAEPAIDEAAKASRSRADGAQALLQVLEAVDKRELRGITHVAFAAKALFVGFANIQTTLNIVFATCRRRGKITLP